MDKVLYNWFTALNAEGKPVTGSVIIKNSLFFFFNEMEITDKCTLSDGWLHYFRAPAAEGDAQMDYRCD